MNSILNYNQNEIHIENLEIFANHGLYSEETKGQFFCLSLILKTNFEKATKSDDISHTIDYDEICNFIEKNFNKKRFNLLETATQFLAEQLILHYKKINGLKIISYKKQAILKSNVKLKHAKIKITISWHTAFIGIGSNLGDRLKNIKKAIEKLKHTKSIKIEKISTIEETKAYGRKMDDFLNCVIKIKTFATPQKLLEICSLIENDLKRERKIKWGPRTIDLDILFYDNFIVNDDNLTIPHYDIKNRQFVLNSMIEICPNFIHPIYLKTMNELKQELETRNQNSPQTFLND